MAAPAFILAEADEEFVVMVADIAAFAPRLFPYVVAARPFAALDRETALKRDAVGEQKAELRRRDEQLALARQRPGRPRIIVDPDRSEAHTSELQSLMRTSYAVFCLQKKRKPT